MKQSAFKRSDRVSHQIKEIISEVFSSKSSIDGSGLITITEVQTTHNLRFSRIYVSFIGNKIPPEVIVQYMNSNINDYRYQLGNSIQVKYVPKIKFYYDDTMEEVEKINSLLHKANDNNIDG